MATVFDDNYVQDDGSALHPRSANENKSVEIKILLQKIESLQKLQQQQTAQYREHMLQNQCKYSQQEEEYSVKIEQLKLKIKKQKIKYDGIVHKTIEYEKLIKELQEINDKYNKKNQLLNEKQTNLEDENQNLRQLLLQYETQETQRFEEYHQEIEVIKNEMKLLQTDFELPHDNDSKESNDDIDQRRRRMTLKIPDEPAADDGDGTLYAEIGSSRGRKLSAERSRRHTIKMWYESHVKKGSYLSIPNEEQFKSMSDDANTAIVVSIDRQYSDQSYQMDAKPEPIFKDKTDSANSITAHDDMSIFEDAVAQELKTELRKQIEKELQEDYQLKLQQKDIEHQLKLHQELQKREDEQRRFQEKYEKQIDEIQAKLRQYTKYATNNNVLVDKEEMVYLDGDENGMTNLSSPISEYEYSDDEKDVFDQLIKLDDDTGNMQYIQSLIDKKKDKDNEYTSKNHQNNQSICSCFSLFAD